MFLTIILFYFLQPEKAKQYQERLKRKQQQQIEKNKKVDNNAPKDADGKEAPAATKNPINNMDGEDLAALDEDGSYSE